MDSEGERRDLERTFAFGGMRIPPRPVVADSDAAVRERAAGSSGSRMNSAITSKGSKTPIGIRFTNTSKT
jgi:hypothetical protein